VQRLPAGENVRWLNIVQVVYDPYQMEAVAQRLRGLSMAWVEPCDQSTERLIADSEFHKYALSGRLAHTGDPKLREHVLNARAKLQKDEDSTLRIVKKAPNRKIDLAVAASMAIKRVLYLNL
jgi:phage terminase large subunit-like protein